MKKPHVAFQEATHGLGPVRQALTAETISNPERAAFLTKGVEGSTAPFVGIGFAPIHLLVGEEPDEDDVPEPVQFFYSVMDALRCDYLRGPEVNLEIPFSTLAFAVFNLTRPYEVLSRMDLEPLHEAMAPLSFDRDIAMQLYIPELYEAARALGYDSIIIRPSAYEAGQPYRFGPPSFGGEGPAAPQVIVPPDEDVAILLQTSLL